MTLHYAGKHRAPRQAGPVRRTGTGFAAAAALGVSAPLAVTALTAAPAMANGGPTVPQSSNASTEAPAPEAAPEPTTTEPTSTESTDESSNAESTESDSSSAGLLEIGDTGGAVEALQSKLGVTADGVFGPETQDAVEDLQADSGIAVDGIVGPDTRAALAGGSQGSDDTESTTSETATTETANTDSTTADSTSSETSTTDAGDSTTVTASADSDEAEVSTASTSTAGSAAGSSITATAASLLGTTYTMGGSSPSEGFDCSGYTQYVYGQHGIDIPRTTGAQQAAATPVSNPQPGDLVFFGDSAYHVAIYAGDGMVYDAGNESVDTTKRAIWTDDVSYGRF